MTTETSFFWSGSFSSNPFHVFLQLWQTAGGPCCSTGGVPPNTLASATLVTSSSLPPIAPPMASTVPVQSVASHSSANRPSEGVNSGGRTPEQQSAPPSRSALQAPPESEQVMLPPWRLHMVKQCGNRTSTATPVIKACRQALRGIGLYVCNGGLE